MGKAHNGTPTPGGNGMPDWFQAAMRQQQAAMEHEDYDRCAAAIRALKEKKKA